MEIPRGDGGGGGGGGSSENGQSFFFNISRKKSKTSKVNLNLKYFIIFLINLDRTITFNSVTLKNTQTEPQKNIIFFNETNNI